MNLLDLASIRPGQFIIVHSRKDYNRDTSYINEIFEVQATDENMVYGRELYGSGCLENRITRLDSRLYNFRNAPANVINCYKDVATSSGTRCTPVHEVLLERTKLQKEKTIAKKGVPFKNLRRGDLIAIVKTGNRPEDHIGQIFRVRSVARPFVFTDDYNQFITDGRDPFMGTDEFNENDTIVIRVNKAAIYPANKPVPKG